MCCACPACQPSFTSRVTVSSQSQRQPFTRCQVQMTSILAQASPPHRSNQFSAIPSNPPLMEGFAPGTSRNTATKHPRSSPHCFPRNPSPGNNRSKFQLRLREYRLHPPMANSYQKWYIWLKAQDMTPIAVERSLGHDLSAISLSGTGASFSRQENRSDSLDANWTLGVTIRTFPRFSPVPLRFNIECNLLEF